MLRSHEPLLFTEQLRKHAAQAGRKVAAIDDNGQANYAELWDAISAVSGALQDQGLGKGDRVAIAMSPSLGHLVLILGCMAAGIVPCILNIRLTAAEFARFLEPIAPSRIITDREHAGLVAGLGVEVIVLDGPHESLPLRERLQPLWSERARTAQLTEDDLALIIPTGGTTGIPKGAVFTHRSLFLWLAACCYNAGRTAHEVELFFSPFFHVSAVTGWMTTLFASGAVRILRGFSVERALEAIEQGATFLMGAPTMFSALRRHPDFQALDRSRIRFVVFGSTAAAPDFIAQMMADYPQARLKHGYGATEFGPVTAILHEDFKNGRIDGVGRAVQGVRITIVDDDLRPLPPGQVGELVVACPWQVVGYWGRPEETAQTMTPLGIRLGDLGSMDEDGWITIAGRKKEMIISGGENVFPNEVEAVLSRHPAVRDISVYGAKDDYWGERVEAAVVLQPGAALTQQELADFGRAQLGGYKLPKTLRIVEAIPLTPNNKPDRRRLSLEAEARQRS